MESPFNRSVAPSRAVNVKYGRLGLWGDALYMVEARDESSQDLGELWVCKGDLDGTWAVLEVSRIRHRRSSYYDHHPLNIDPIVAVIGLEENHTDLVSMPSFYSCPVHFS